MEFERRFARPFLVRATDRGGLVLGALAEAAEADPTLAEHFLCALAAAEVADLYLGELCAATTCFTIYKIRSYKRRGHGSITAWQAGRDHTPKRRLGQIAEIEQ